MKNYTQKLFLLLLFCSLKSDAMESHINVKTVTEKINIEVPIQNNTTISDIKDTLQNSEGISQELQHLYAREPHWLFGTWSQTRSEELVDDANITDVIEAYRTRELALILILNRNNQNTTN